MRFLTIKLSLVGVLGLALSLGWSLPATAQTFSVSDFCNYVGAGLQPEVATGSGFAMQGSIGEALAQAPPPGAAAFRVGGGLAYCLGGGSSIGQPLTGVTITGLTSGPAGEYVFFPEVEPENATLPISYEWDNSDTTVYTLRSFPNLGVYTVSVTASNLDGLGLATDTVTVNINQETDCATPVTNVIISGPATAQIGDTSTFQAQVIPASPSQPLTYTWLPAPNSGQGTPTASYTWTSREYGLQSVGVIVQNCASQASVANTQVSIISLIPVILKDFNATATGVVTASAAGTD